ncbi:MAG: hypothetical protein JWL59_4616 [Chthoniobacteraceae bacterium]|nr:hypothetical protein [Chthoniobacteraceae bacterium]
MKTRLLVSTLLAISLCARFAAADNEIGFIEKFALAPDREAVLTQLIPGSEEFYFFHALHFQNTGQKQKLKATMEQWAVRFPKSAQRAILENREALLNYDADPQSTLQFLRTRLNPEFNHQQEVRDKKPDLPTTLDAAKISTAIFQRDATRDSDDLANCTEAALERFVRERVALTPPQRRVILGRLIRPDLPGLLELIEADLKSKESGGFGQYPIHGALLPEQLDALGQRIPSLYDSQAFVYTRLRKLLPSADADIEFDPVERRAWLERVWAYSKNLSPSFNNLKAHVLYLRLIDDRARGEYNKALFLDYLKLPRRAPYIRPEYVDQAGRAPFVVDLNADVSAALPGTVPIGNDEWLVREFLLEILKDEPAWEPYAVYLRENFIKALFAEAKIINGIDAPEKWASLLSPAAFQALKERVDIDFIPANPRFIAPAAEVVLQAAIKNAPKLIVKIYEINTLSYFLSHHEQLNTDLQLDGLVANVEKIEQYEDSPVRRITRTFKFPELTGRRGAWIIEFIGGGKSSRTLVRKGEWQLLQQTGPAGEMLTIIDESHKPVPNAAAWFEGRKLVPDEKSGRIIVPFGGSGGSKPIILADATGDFASLTNFEHHTEEYRLDAHFHIEREQLLAGREATVAIRTALLLGDTQVAASLLLEPKLTITSTTLDGVVTTREVGNLSFDPAKVSTHTFRVPERLANLTISLNAKVENLSAGGEKKEISASRTWDVNGIDKTALTGDGHFSRIGADYIFDLLGKNGEPLSDQQVVFEFHHREFENAVSVALRSGENGRIDLGPLFEIRTVSASLPNGRKQSMNIRLDGASGPNVIHAKAGTVIEVPWSGDGTPLKPEMASLLEERGGTFVADRFGTLSIAGGFLQLKELPPGDYSLRVQPGNQRFEIRVTAGVPILNWLISETRHLEIRSLAPLQIETIREDADAYFVQLRNVNPLTRVHVSGSRFYPQKEWQLDLDGFPAAEPVVLTPARRPNLFVAGRSIGDEYRYILERRYAKLFPGNMLARPGLLLNPWEVRSTDLAAQSMEAGQNAQASKGDRESLRRAAPVAPAPVSAILSPAPGGKISSNLDFLATAGPAVYNLIPDEKGVVKIERKWLGDRQQIQIYAEDLTSSVYRFIALTQTNARFQDLRLSRNLDPAKNLSERKQVTLLAPGESLKIADLLTAELETYDSLAGIYALFTTLSHDSNLAAFAWVLQWPKLKEEEKRAKYSEFACHELNFFLARKDPDFFKTVIQPSLRNKKEKTFMDEWLLGNDLQRFLKPWAFARLNMAERALLSQRIPGEGPATARHLQELYDLLPPDPDLQERLFGTALLGRSTHGGLSGGFGEAKADAIQRAGAEKNAPASMALGTAVMAATAAPGKRMKLMEKAESSLGLESDPKPAEKAGESRGRGYAIFDSLSAEDGVRLRAEVRQFYRKLGPTKEWAENNYYRLPISRQDAKLISINAFWRDYAAWDGKTAFLSKHMPEASRNFSEMMLALAVLDLPFESPKHTTKSEQKEFTITAAGPLIIFHKEIEPVGEAPQGSELLVSENFFRHDDREQMEGNESFAKYVSDEFLPGVVYGANVVVTNPTSSPQKLELLNQIPKGALPLLGSKATNSPAVRLEPYTTRRFEYFFYFPAPAAEPFAHYPVHVARKELNVGAAKPFNFKVVKQLSKVDAASWDYISQYGSDDEAFAFLTKANLQRIPLERIAWRARTSVEFWRKLIAFLAGHHVYNDVLYSYAVVHNEPAALGEWLMHRDEFIAQCGPWFTSKLITIDPIERRAYQQLEYTPLVNQRAHRLGAENRIPNPVLRGQYQELLRILTHKPALDPIDEMSVTYYLFLQDRVEEALVRFETIKPELLPTRIQYDYFRCYAAFYREKPEEARSIASSYQQYPVDRWRKLFSDVIIQINEVEGAATQPVQPATPDRDARQAELTGGEPSFDFKVDNRTIALNWRNLREVTVNYYRMDPEFLFSSNPFVAQDPGRFSIIKPGRSMRLVLPEGKEMLEIPLPEDFARANVLVEIFGAGQRKTEAYHANTLRLILMENCGRLELRDQAANKPVSKAYVKVYARLRNGQTRFFKDGYSDLRGRFDYSSLNSSEHEAPPVPMARNIAPGAPVDTQMLRPEELGQVEKLAILVVSEKNGTLTREVNPPGE